MTEFLGVGWRFPVTDEQTGKIQLTRYEASVRQSIWIILSTAPGERLMRPTFGCGIHELIAQPNSSTTAGQAANQAREALIRWEPRIDLLDVSAAPDAGQPTLLLITIAYRVRSTNNRFNLVYPFYLE